MRLGLQNTYSGLPSRFHARIAPVPVREPRLVVFNFHLAEELASNQPSSNKKLKHGFQAIKRPMTPTRSLWPMRVISSGASCRSSVMVARFCSESGWDVMACCAISRSRAL
jgi:hypothetical protein